MINFQKLSKFYSIILILSFSMVVFGRNIKFRHLTINESLSQNTVYCILQDKDGFMWFGTQDGLNRFDGYQFRIYRHQEDDSTSISNAFVNAVHMTKSGAVWIGTRKGLNKYNADIDGFENFFYNVQDQNSLSHNYVTSVFEDKDSILWIGSKDGLNSYNYETGNFTRYYHDIKNDNSLSSDKITTIFEEQSGTLWIGTEEGLNRYESEKNCFTRYVHDVGNSRSLSNNFITYIYQDDSGNLWIGTQKGLNRFNRKTESFTCYFNEPDNPSSLSNNHITSIYEDNSGTLWIGTIHQLNQFDTSLNNFIRYKTDPSDVTSLNNDYILSIYQDRSGLLWMGTYSGGVNTFEGTNKSFKHYHVKTNTSNSLNNNDVLSFYEDNRGILWIGTYGGGLNRLNRATGMYKAYKHDPENLYSLSNDFVRTILEDHQGALWVGTDAGGMNRFNRQTERFIRHMKNSNDPYSINSNIISDIYEDSYNNLWIATERGGLNRYDRDSNRFYHFLSDSANPTSLSFNDVFLLYEDKAGTLWIGTYGGGLNKLVNNKEKIVNPQFISYRHSPGDPHSLSNDFIMAISEDHSGNIWIGTSAGLNRFDPEKEIFKVYTTKDGLPNSTIYGMLTDRQGNLWMSTNKGISRLDPVTEIFRNYDVNNGLQSNEFWGMSCFKNNRGEFFFGGVNGFNVFYPDSVKENIYIPPVVITDFQIFNESVSIGEKVNGRIILEKSILKTDRIKLRHKERSFSFEFAALNYISPEGNEYKYKMEGFENKWNSIGNRRFATYTSLPPGHYTFKVIGSNNDGVWNEKGDSIDLTIIPPFWKTWWFRSLLILLVLAGAFSWYRIRVKSLEKQKQKLEKQVKERTAEIRNKNKQLEQKNEQILSSIRYGERIQHAILPLTEKIRSSLPEHFILYKPRDIVSGDFYWFNKLNGKTVLAVVDCTGHGVPGAFMSMLGNAFLNEIVTVQQILDPALILKHLHEEVRLALKQKHGKTKTQDGMDVCLCILEKNSHQHKLVFAGAKRPLYIIKEGKKELTEIKGDRKSIGGRQREGERIFTAHELSLDSGDNLYLTTDGYADQQNPGNRRYGSGRLKTFLQKVSDLEMQEQAKALSHELARHQDKEEQRDDITLIGLKI